MEKFQAAIFIIFVVFILLVILYTVPFGLWFKATISGVRITFMEFILMRLRNAPTKDIVQGLIVSTKGNLGLSRDQLEALAISGGNVQNVVFGMVTAKRAGFPLSFDNAVKADAQGHDISKNIKEKMRQTEKVVFE